ALWCWRLWLVEARHLPLTVRPLPALLKVKVTDAVWSTVKEKIVPTGGFSLCWRVEVSRHFLCASETAVRVGAVFGAAAIAIVRLWLVVLPSESALVTVTV